MEDIKNPKNIIKKVVFDNLPDSTYNVFLFWSRVSWGYKKNSDYDIWIIWNKKLDLIKFLKIKRELEKLPYIIDLVDFYDIDEGFKEIALKNIEKWN